MKILISGFEPFGKMNINPTEELLKEAVSFDIENVEISTVLLPVNYDECAEELIAKIEEVNPDVVISCGLAAGRTAITPERIGINIKDTGSGDPYPDAISNSAGTFICNNTLYAVLNYIQKNNLPIKAGFIHFPASTEMSSRNPALPSLPQEVMTSALKVIIQTCDRKEF
jgi:pyroglutamyl-peptidase